VTPPVEKAVGFGPGGARAGGWVEPPADAALAGAPTILIGNTGLNHHVGPWRFNVDLTRALAARGFSSLRFDASGLGDSDSRADVATEQDRWLADLRDAMAVAEKRRGPGGYVLLGFCSSTDHAHHVALEDERVKGVVYVEGFAYRSRAFWRRYPKRYLDTNRWERMLKRNVKKLAGEPVASHGPSMFNREYPKPERYRDDLKKLLDRGVKLQITFSGGDTDFNHLEQFDDMLQDTTIRPRIDLAFYPEADHTFFRVKERRVLIEHLAEWMVRSWPRT
jgi:pimeloyl-ACP methyl ester carboxylesterase